MGMDIQALRAFHAVMTEGNATVAARRLGVGQPHVSRLVAALERHTGVALFVRRRGRLVPTDEALLFHREVERALLSVEALDDVARSLAASGGGRQRRLRVLVQSHLAHSLMPGVIARLARDRPAIRIDLDIRQRHSAVDWSGQRAFDAAVVALPLEREGVTLLPLFRSPACVILPPGHALMAREAIALTELAAEPLVLLRPGLPKRDRLGRAAQEAGLTLRAACETTSALSAAQLALHGVAPAVVDSFVAEALATDPRLVVRHTDAVLDATYVLAVPASEASGMTIERFHSATTEAARANHTWFMEAVRSQTTARLR